MITRLDMLSIAEVNVSINVNISTGILSQKCVRRKMNSTSNMTRAMYLNCIALGVKPTGVI